MDENRYQVAHHSLNNRKSETRLTNNNSLKYSLFFQKLTGSTLLSETSLVVEKSRMEKKEKKKKS